jgi:membrane fusion protein, multidrug efflux system
MNAPVVESKDTPPPGKKRRKMAIWYWAGVGVLLLAALLIWFFYWQYKEYTDDAYVEGNQVFITPLRSGFVTAIHTDDTFLATYGQLLVELDETDSSIELNRAKDNLAQTVREVCELFHQLFAYRAEIEVRKAEFIKSAQDFEHRQNVIDAGGVSIEDFEHAIAALRASFHALQATEALYDKTFSLIQGTSIKQHPLVLRAAERVRDAWVQLYRCKIYAPVEGLTAQRKIQVGMWVHSGHPLMSVIPLDQIWINANFKETQLKKMRIGQSARITSDLYGREVVFHGRVVGLPGGAGNIFSLLPPQNLSGNWIKIVQRLPVRIALDPKELLAHPLRVGLSMEVTVDLHDQQGLLVPTSNAGSPTYATEIFGCEEQGDQKLIATIIEENLDPLLSEYADQPLQIVMENRS